jgi:hypothetical protein
MCALFPFISFIFSCFAFSFIQILIYVCLLTSGASSPEELNRTTEGGDICFWSIHFLFVIFPVCYMFVFVFVFGSGFVYIGILTDVL